MIKRMLVCALFLLFSLCAFAQEQKMAAGLGLEWNMDSRHNFAGGAVLGFNYNLSSDYALGFTFTGSNNFGNFTSIEPTLLVRRYFSIKEHPGFFGQIDVGAFIYFEDSEVTPMFEAGLRGGYRMPLKPPFYVEPYGRLGYPFAFGIGVMGGMTF